MTTKKNESLYRQLSTPFDGATECNEELNAFFEGLYELRKKHRIRDVLCVVEVSVMYPDSDEPVPARSAISIGDSFKAEPMAHYVAGFYSAQAAELRNEQHMSGRRAFAERDGKRTKP